MYLETVRQVVKNGPFVIIDTETTALDGEPVEIAVIDQDGKILLHTLMKPSAPIGADAMAIHHITNEMVAGAPSYPDLQERLITLLSAIPVLSYNAVFDRKMLHNAGDAFQMKKVNWKELAPWVCVMEAFAEFHGEWNDFRKSYTWKSLSFAGKHVGIATDGAHGALADCMITLGVVRFLAVTHKKTW